MSAMTRDERVHELLYSCEDREELAERIAQLEGENAKLRELCAELLDNLMPEVCAKAPWCSDKDWKACGDHACGNYTFVILARELGVEDAD